VCAACVIVWRKSNRESYPESCTISIHGLGLAQFNVDLGGQESRAALPPDPPSHGSVKPPPLALQIKSLRNKKDYERRKTQRAEQAVEHLKDELLTSKNNISFLELINKHESLQVSQLKDSAEESALLLTRRSPLFCRSLFMLHLLMHLTQQSTLLQLGIEQIRALTTMFTVEDSSHNEFGDNHNGWENNKQC
jgi:hypothetical protein